MLAESRLGGSQERAGCKMRSSHMCTSDARAYVDTSRAYFEGATEGSQPPTDALRSIACSEPQRATNNPSSGVRAERAKLCRNVSTNESCTYLRRQSTEHPRWRDSPACDIGISFGDIGVRRARTGVAARDPLSAMACHVLEGLLRVSRGHELVVDEQPSVNSILFVRIRDSDLHLESHDD